MNDGTTGLQMRPLSEVDRPPSRILRPSDESHVSASE